MTETPRKTTATTPARSTRLVLLVGILSGISTLVAAPFFSPEQYMLASDVYLTAAEALLAGEDIYAVAPPGRPGYHYIYPPVVVFVFLPYAVVGSPLGAYAIQTALNLAFGAGIGVVCGRMLARRGVDIERVDWLLLVGFGILSSYSAITVVNGQVTLWLAFAFAVGFDALERGREQRAGVAFALAALVKIFPAAIGLWLVRRRAWRAVVAATATGLTGLALGVVLLGPETTVTYLTEVVTGRYEGFDGAPEPTETRGGAQRQIAALFGLGPPLLTPLAALVLAPVVAVLYRRVDTDLRRQAAILGTIAATLLFLPLQRLYLPLLVVPLVLLCYLLPASRARTVLLVGTLVSFMRLDYAVVAATVEAALPLAVSGPLTTGLEWLFRVVLPPTLGLWLLLAACVLVHLQDGHQTVSPERRGSST